MKTIFGAIQTAHAALPSVFRWGVLGALLNGAAWSAQAWADVPANTIVSEHTGKAYKAKRQRTTQSHNKKIKVYKYSDGGTASFSDQAPEDQTYEVLSYKCFACDVSSTIDWWSIKLYPDRYAQTISLAALEHGVDPALIRAVIHAESAFRPSVKSHVGAVGLMQLMPATALEVGVADRLDPTQNIQGGVRYLAKMLERFDGDVTLATAAYNAGPGAVQRHGGVPPYAETQAYVKRVAILAERYRS